MIAAVFDTETTALITTRAMSLERLPEVLSLSFQYTDLATGEAVRVGNHLFKPSKPIPSDATKVNGITNEMVADAPPFKELAYIVKEDLEVCDVVIAHNAAFDRDMIDIEMRRCALTVNWPRIICTVEQTIWLDGHRMSLTRLHKYLFDEDFEEKHSAAGDVAALVRCCVELYSRGWL